jgi:cobalt-zinc-cadmium efflux system outer membrane protein
MPVCEVVLTLVVLSIAGPAGASEPLTLADATARALAQGAEVKAAEQEVAAARAGLAGASAPLASNPELTVGAGPRTAGATRSVDFELALSQRFELGGQRGIRVARERAAVAAAEARLADLRARAAAGVRVQFGRIAAARARAELAATSASLALQALQAAERRLQAGDAPRAEVNSARIERARALREGLRADQELLAARSELGRQLALEPGAPPEIAFALEDLALAPDAQPAELARDAVAGRRDVAAARLDLEAAEAEARLSARSALPAPALGVSFAREEGAQVVLGTLSLELPIFTRNQGERGATRARAEQARLALAEAERRASREVWLALERLRSARRGVEAFDAVTAAALEENLASAARAFGAGQIDFARYAWLTREALEARRERVDALEELNEAAAWLAVAEGREAARAP